MANTTLQNFWKLWNTGVKVVGAGKTVQKLLLTSTILSSAQKCRHQLRREVVQFGDVCEQVFKKKNHGKHLGSLKLIKEEKTPAVSQGNVEEQRAWFSVERYICCLLLREGVSRSMLNFKLSLTKPNDCLNRLSVVGFFLIYAPYFPMKFTGRTHNTAAETVPVESCVGRKELIMMNQGLASENCFLEEEVKHFTIFIEKQKDEIERLQNRIRHLKLTHSLH